MARVYVCRYGLPLAKGIGLGELTLAECLTKLKVVKVAYLGGPTTKVQFGNPEDALAKVKGFAHVVVLVAEPEATANGWKAGYYLSAVPARGSGRTAGQKAAAHRPIRGRRRQVLRE
ncbi:MAG: hypothetical protein WDO24_06840 [Pseudomonadota bacterium]